MPAFSPLHSFGTTAAPEGYVPGAGAAGLRCGDSGRLHSPRRAMAMIEGEIGTVLLSALKMGPSYSGGGPLMGSENSCPN
jgi:hypothetical protein